jgi:hypothetical protein
MIRNLILSQDISTLSNHHVEQMIFLKVQLLPFLTQSPVRPVRMYKQNQLRSCSTLLLCLDVLFSQASTVVHSPASLLFPIAGGLSVTDHVTMSEESKHPLISYSSKNDSFLIGIANINHFFLFATIVNNFIIFIYNCFSLIWSCKYIKDFSISKDC